MVGIKETVFRGNNSSEINYLHHGYSYNKCVITKLHSSGFFIQLKGGYK